jgi:hypothetical protein
MNHIDQLLRLVLIPDYWRKNRKPAVTPSSGKTLITFPCSTLSSPNISRRVRRDAPNEPDCRQTSTVKA